VDSKSGVSIYINCLRVYIVSLPRVRAAAGWRLRDSPTDIEHHNALFPRDILSAVKP
jgi:hypothetical protein